MYNFDPINVLSIATNIAVLLMTAFVLQGHMLEVLPLKLAEIDYKVFVNFYLK